MSEVIRIPIDVTEAIDHEAPVLAELTRAKAVIDLANRALLAHGIVLVAEIGSE